MSARNLSAVLNHRIVQFVAEVLPQLSAHAVPGPLRPMAHWRRDRIAGVAQAQILGYLDSDEDFAASVASRLVLSNPLAKSLADDPDSPDLEQGDPLVVAALLSIARPDGWQEKRQTLLDKLAVPASPEPTSASTNQNATKQRRQTDRLKKQIEELSAIAADLRAQLREQATRRRTEIGQLSQQVTQLQDELYEVAAALELERASNRRLTKQLEQAQQAKQAVRRSQRQAEAAENARLAVLLATLTEATAGIAAELAIPINAGKPADFVAAVKPEPIGKSAGLGPLAALQEALAAPQCHLIVDGYNVSKAAWPTRALRSNASAWSAGWSTFRRDGDRKSRWFSMAQLCPEFRP